MVLRTINCLDLISPPPSIVGDYELIGWLHIHRQFHDPLDGIGIVGGSKVKTYGEGLKVDGILHAAVCDVREVNLKVHGMDRRVLVSHDNGGVGLGYELRDTVTPEEGVLHVGSTVVEEPHAVRVASNTANSLDKVSSRVASVEDTEV